ncbi:MAG TPA: carboxypeptidase regulatory-like domain-containing protein [Candidatus Sulfotelmatobacter sp.]|nr:carboxypeptidase regulatory-like domain-containing protein [Candidatus Sulfotelmatobacter sp.]
MLIRPNFRTRRLSVRALAVITALGVFLFAQIGAAQTTISTGSIQGVVTDPSGAVVSGAKVIISNKATGRVITVATTSAGAYASGALTPGDYTLHIEASGFKSAETTLTVQVGVTATGNVKLQVGQSSQVVEVQSTTLAVNTEQATVQGVLNAQQIESLPINGRNFLDLAQLEPGIQIQDGGNFDPTKNGFSSISFGGRFGRTARIEVDGLDISDETVGTTTQNIPASDVQEFQLQQSSLDLSTELTSSGSVNVTTKSGTNGVHGEAFDYFRDQSLNANLPGGTHNPFQRSQFGGNVGGPIIKDKLFFFADVERTKQDLLEPVLSSGPFTAITGSFTSPFRESEASGRLDWQINDKYKFFYRFSYDENRSISAGVPNAFQPFATVTHTPSHAMGLDFNTGPYTHSIRFGYMKFRNAIVDAVAGSPIFNPAPGIELAIGNDPDCLTPGADVFCSGPSFLAPQQTYQTNHQLKYDGSRAIGSHILRYGGGWNHIFSGGFASFLKLGPAVNAQLLDCNAACQALPGGAANPLNYPANTVQLGNGQGSATEIPAFGFPGGGTGPDERLSAYFGDSWKVKPTFTLTYGVRYVRDTWRTDSDLAAIPPLYQFDNQFYSGLGNRVRQPNVNFAPQLGIAWDPSGKGKTVLRGGIGLFYENSIWNNIEFDRPARLKTGLFLATPSVCSSGSPSAFTLPNGSTPNLSFCGETISQAIPQILALQAEYQAQTAAVGPSAPNPSFIGTTLTDGFNATGTDLLGPNYVSPRSVQMNLGFQHEFRPGTILSVDYLRNVETHTLLAIDTNHVGDARFFNRNAALLAIATTLANCGQPSIDLALKLCPTDPLNGTNDSGKYTPRPAVIADFASPKTDPVTGNPISGGLDSGYSSLGGFPASQDCGPTACLTPNTGAAFAGINPNLGANQMLFPIGRSLNTSLQFSLKQHIARSFHHVSNFDFQFSYQLERYIALVQDSDFVNFATDFNNPLKYIGPDGLDRKHQFSFGGTMDLPFHFRLGMIGHFYSPLPLTLTVPPSGVAGGIFVSDLTGDGTGDGSFTSNGGFGDVLPGTNVGSFGHGVSTRNLNNIINAYNLKSGFQPTPAGQVLLSNGLFRPDQLQSLGGVQQLIQPVPANEAAMGWLHAFDASLNWVYKVKETVTIQPGVSFFNAPNFSNFDGPANPLSGSLLPFGSGPSPGTINGTSGQQPSSNRLGLGSGVFALGSPRSLEFSLKVNF